MRVNGDAFFLGLVIIALCVGYAYTHIAGWAVLGVGLIILSAL
jgi:hypothetical protein